MVVAYTSSIGNFVFVPNSPSTIHGDGHLVEIPRIS
ncbi:hypothetical protein GAYE_SCF67G6875 [Galdieria yellowstonensis]|uniref:Uncharacterized protein n=1 Tax=Galdieria yellowstonensis TaxID=3028027 RepID=A0AAV9IN38_9RHOD|nr:hypothetical protein GAYE_SCF67G6875 [Galdieria yellowstonensis]